MIPRLFQPPKGSYFLFGPRGSGKSTWLRYLHPDAHWIDLLDEGRLRVRERRHPKLYWVDPGLVRAVTHALGAPNPEASGALFEGWVAQCLRAYNDYNGLYDDIAYWAPADAQQTEVDFLLRRGRRYVAIEVKAARRWRPEMAKGLRAIAALSGVKRRIVVYQGAQALRPDQRIRPC